MFYTKVGKNEFGKLKSMLLFAFFLVPVVVFVIGAEVPQARAAEFAEAEIFFEYNSTDKDLGIHIFFDAEAWKEVEVRGEDGEEIFEAENDENLKKLGSTEVFTESAEPPLCPEDAEEDDCDVDEAIAEFQARFPEGDYKFRGRTIDGKRLRGSVYLSHDLPTPPDILQPEEGDSLANPFVIAWAPGAGGPDIAGYEVVAEMVIDDRTFVNTATLPAGVTRFTVARQFMRLAARAHRAGLLEEFKVEVISRAVNLNKTITELVVVEEE